MFKSVSIPSDMYVNFFEKQNALVDEYIRRKDYDKSALIEALKILKTYPQDHPFECAADDPAYEYKKSLFDLRTTLIEATINLICSKANIDITEI